MNNECSANKQHEVLCEIVQLAKDYADVEIIWLYGSRARNHATFQSDYDLAVAFTTFIHEPVDGRLRPELLALEWQRKLNVKMSIIDINRVPLPLAYTVIQDNMLLYSKNDYRRMTEEQRIMSKWEIDYCYHKKHYA